MELSTRAFRCNTQDEEDDPFNEEMCPFPDYLIDSGWIHADSVSRFRLFARELLNGCAGGGNFAVRRKGSDCYSWVSVSYRMLFDDAGRAVRAVGGAAGTAAKLHRMRKLVSGSTSAAGKPGG